MTMTATMESLEKRLEGIEQKLASLCQELKHEPIRETPEERGARALATARGDKLRNKAMMAKALAEMGVARSPVPADKLRESMVACGIRPEDNLFSRGITEMRQE